MSYTDADAVALHLGRTLTADQQAQVDALVPVAAAWIDHRTNRSWELSAAITGEAHDLYCDRLYLKQAPVASVEAIRVRSLLPGATARTLTADVDYELLDASLGLVLISTYYGTDYYRASVDYTPNVPLDARIARAATVLVAHWLTAALSGGRGPIRRRTLGDVTIEYAAAAGAYGVPDEVAGLVDQCRRGVPIFA